MNEDLVCRPWGIVTPEFWDRPETRQRAFAEVSSNASAPQRVTAVGGSSEEMPKAYREGILFVISSFTAKDAKVLQSAVVKAEQLDQAMTFEYGEQDLRTISIREMRGWLAHLTGQHEVATRWYLHTVGLLSSLVGTSDDRTRASAKRGIATWLAISDETIAQALAPAILAMATAVEGDESVSTKAVRRRVNAWTPAPALSLDRPTAR